MTQPYPAALVIASLESVSNDNNILYRLVRPLADGSGVESTDRLVNVVPHRRTYCFERKEQLDSFSDEILKRPLVIQPILHFGRGLSPSCGACYDDEPWVVMINQTHPKILGRLQMGLELARSAVAKGQSVEIKFRFGKLIERVYREHLEQKESGEAESKTGLRRTLARVLLQFRFVEWDHGDLILRSHGLAAKLKTSTRLMLEMNNVDKSWDFEDVGMHDMMWNEWQPELVFPRPNLAAVSEDEIRTMLPGWTINSVTPLEAIGEAAPERTYSYAKAGRLYSSFRKIRKSHDIHNYPNTPSDTEANPDTYYRQPQGAEAMPEQWDPQEAKAMPESLYPVDSESRWKETPSYKYSKSTQRDQDQHSHGQAKFMNRFETANDQGKGHAPGLPHADKYGHIVPEVHIQQPQHLSDPLCHLKKQDSDRSSRSTNADSGYCPGTEDSSQRSRGGSYDFNDEAAHIKNFTPSLVDHRYQSQSRDKAYSPFNGQFSPTTTLSNRHEMEGGLENPAFSRSSDDLDSDKALQNHREFVKSVLAEGSKMNSYPFAVDNYSTTVTTPQRQLHTSGRLASSSENIAESFI